MPKSLSQTESATVYVFFFKIEREGLRDIVREMRALQCPAERRVVSSAHVHVYALINVFETSDWKLHAATLELQIWSFRLQHWSFRSEAAAFNHGAIDLKLQATTLRLKIWSFRLQPWSFSFEASGFKPEASDLELHAQTWGLKFEAAGFNPAASDLKLKTSTLKLQLGSFRLQPWSFRFIFLWSHCCKSQSSSKDQLLRHTADSKVKPIAIHLSRVAIQSMQLQPAATWHTSK